MFTGLIQDVGCVDGLRPGPVLTVTLSSQLARSEAEPLVLGESIACDGVCLTVVGIRPGAFDVQATQETLRRSTVGAWRVGRQVNLERALRLSDRLGGHLVQGHVDAVVRLLSTRREGDALWWELELPEAWAAHFIEKGSVALDGVSLTVNTVGKGAFSVALIPETQARTTLKDKRVGDTLNMESDVLGKYVARLLGARGGVTRESLERAGF